MFLLLTATLSLISGPWIVPATNVHEPWNITWLIISLYKQQVVAQVTGQHPQGTWWPALYFDLCSLFRAMGYYGIPECGMVNAANLLTRQCIYACPFTPAKSYCGGQDDYFCGSWGCETTGSCSWINNHSPLKIVKNQTQALTCSGTNVTSCNPLTLTFSAKVKDLNYWDSGYTMGIRVYQSGYDSGALLTVKHIKKPIIKKPGIGPNVLLAPGFPKKGI